MDKLQRVDFWYQKPPGSLLLAYEKQQIGKLLASLPGDVLLQVGGPSDLSLVEKSTIKNKIYYSTDGVSDSKVLTIEGDLNTLPLQSDSVDVVVLTHMLAFANKPSLLLKQVRRVLSPGGHLLILGFNPISVWGIAKLKRSKDGFPWSGKFYTSWKVKSWLRQLDLQLVAYKTMCFRWPSQDKERWGKEMFLEAIGQLLLPGCGGVYMMLARKQSPGLTPLRNVWGRRKKLVYPAGYAKPSTQDIHKVITNEESTDLY